MRASSLISISAFAIFETVLTTPTPKDYHHLPFLPVSNEAVATSPIRPNIHLIPVSSPKTTSSIGAKKNRFVPAKHYTAIRGSRFAKSGSKSAAVALGAAQRLAGIVGGYTNITASTAYGTQYVVTVNLGGQDLDLVLDTGSSDTWAPKDDFACTAWSGEELTQTECAFGPTFHGDFPDGAIPNEHFHLAYGDGETVQGRLGKMDVSIAGVTATNQTVALADSSYWNGNNVTSGILGLAYPLLTGAFYGDNETEHDSGEAMQYTPVFNTMVGQGLIENYFSIAISRNSSEGVLALGGVPDFLEGVDYETTAMTDITVANVGGIPSSASQLSFYSIIPDGFVFGSMTAAASIPYIVDTGTTLMYLPPDLAEAVNAAFSPPAYYDYFQGGYYTDCDAIAPKFAVVIDNTYFYLNPRDLIHRDLQDPLSGLCLTSFTSGGINGPYILGDTFLQNVLAIFDVDYGTMEFASRRFY